MKTMIIILTQVTNLTPGYIIGMVIALGILGYLIYSLIKPENF